MSEPQHRKDLSNFCGDLREGGRKLFDWGSVILVNQVDFQDLEFASVIVQKLNIILITSPELAEFRKRLKSLETRVSHSVQDIAKLWSTNLPHSKMVRLCSRLCTGRGVTMLSPSSLSASLLKHMNMPPIFCTFCESQAPNKMATILIIGKVQTWRLQFKCLFKSTNLCN